MVSSEDGKRDCENFFPAARGRIVAVPFAVELPTTVLDADASAVVAQHGLPPEVFLLSGTDVATQEPRHAGAGAAPAQGAWHRHGCGFFGQRS